MCLLCDYTEIEDSLQDFKEKGMDEQDNLCQDVKSE